MNALAKFRILAGVWKPRFFGFFQGHTALNQTDLAEVEALIDRDEHVESERQFENAFAQTAIGGGEGISFAAGRMAFYSLLQALNIGKGDEVLLTGFTCSVMANAIWRTGATVRYADISADTLGTSPAGVLRKINPRTRAIVAQHTFGVPCDADELAEIARSRGIPLIEDCALALGSTLAGRPVGSWGEAAIFSTDHSKPINTVTGGLLVTRNSALAARVRAAQQAAPPLDRNHRHRLWERLLLERAHFTPQHYGRGRAISMMANVPRKLRERFTKSEEAVFLEADFKPRIKPDAYPYPARLPAFLARVGLFELTRWPGVAEHRRSVLSRLLDAATPSLRTHFPAAYADPRRHIVPLRLAYAHPGAAEIERRMRSAVDFDYVWFREPVVAATLGPSSFGYQPGDSPIAERVGGQIINWPCDVPEEDVPALLELFRTCHRGL